MENYVAKPHPGLLGLPIEVRLEILKYLLVLERNHRIFTHSDTLTGRQWVALVEGSDEDTGLYNPGEAGVEIGEDGYLHRGF